MGGMSIPSTISTHYPPAHHTLQKPTIPSRTHSLDQPQDAAIAYTDTRFSFEEYPSFKEGALRDMNPLGTIPVVELNGRFLTQGYAILRHFARLLGKYEGRDEEERYWADSMCDVASDCA